MAGGMITEQAVLAFEEALKRGEYAKGSVEKYVRDVRGFVGSASGIFGCSGRCFAARSGN